MYASFQYARRLDVPFSFENWACTGPEISLVVACACAIFMFFRTHSVSCHFFLLAPFFTVCFSGFAFRLRAASGRTSQWRRWARASRSASHLQLYRPAVLLVPQFSFLNHVHRGFLNLRRLLGVNKNLIPPNSNWVLGRGQVWAEFQVIVKECVTPKTSPDPICQQLLTLALRVWMRNLESPNLETRDSKILRSVSPTSLQYQWATCGA